MRSGTTYDVWILPGKPGPSANVLWNICGPAGYRPATARIEGAASPQEAARRAADGRWNGDDLYVVTQSVTRHTARLWKLSLCPRTLRTVVKEIKG